MKIDYLANHPDWIGTIALWIQNEWGSVFHDITKESASADFRNELHHDRLPLAYVALEKAEPVGVVSLRSSDMGRSELTPWLSALYVLPDHRRKGIGRALVNAVIQKTKQLGVGTLYLGTMDKQNYFAHQGWVTYEQSRFRGHMVTVMRKKLG